MQLYPMLFQPVFKDYMWGGMRLENFGRDLPEHTRIAESWEISAHEDGMTIVENGIYAGKTLQSVLDLLGEDLIGTRNKWALEKGKFPLLVKLLDAHEKLSVQVHPGDAYAQEHEHGELGKTEMWVVLDAGPGAAVIFGLSEKVNREELRAAIANGSVEIFFHKVPISRGDHICVPAGTLHAILAGAVITEIQQNSNVTYRVFDWNRVDENGKARTLHIDQALDVINYDQVALSLTEPEIIDSNKDFVRQRLCQNPTFTTERFLMQPGGIYTGLCDGSSLEIWGLLQGEASVAGQPLSAVQYVLLPARMGPFEVHASDCAVLLRVFAG